MNCTKDKTLIIGLSLVLLRNPVCLRFQMALGVGDQFCLRWNNYHCNMTSVINQLLAEEAFVDVTLACDGARIKAHRVPFG